MPLLRPFRLRDGLLSLALVPLLSACGASGGGEVQSASATVIAPRPVPVVRKPTGAPARSAQVHMLPGLEGVIGATSPDLVRQFGPARLDVWEGDARKLQFSGTPCILDIYLYPRSAGNEPQATYVEARRASDGQEVDRVACIAALRKR